MSNELQTQNAKLQTAEDYSKQQMVVDTVKKSVFPTATDAELMLFFHKCQTVGVHPLDGLIHPLKFNSPEGPKVSFIVSIDLLRSRSDRPEYDGMDAPEYTGQMIINFNGEDIEVPEMATVKIYRKDRSRPFVGTARWKEFYPGDKKGHQWRNKPYLMLAKCAEAQARRQAFPQELDKLYTAEELEKTTEMMANITTRTGSKPDVSADDISGDFSNQNTAVGKPTEEQIQALKLISSKQVGFFLGLCKKNNVDPAAVCAYCGIASLDYLTWDNKNPKNSKRIQETIEKKPEFFQKYKPVQKPAPKREQVQPTEETPAVMDQEQFEVEINSFIGIGYTESDLNEDLSMMGIEGGIKNVPVERQQEVLDMLKSREQAGA